MNNFSLRYTDINHLRYALGAYRLILTVNNGYFMLLGYEVCRSD
jgi:hypothetical protein